MVEGKQQYDVLFNNMAQGAFFQAINGSLIDVNPAALKMFGLTREQFLGRTSLDPEWKVVKEDGSELPPELHPSMVALRTGERVTDFIAGVFNPLNKGFTWLNINAIPLFRENEETPYQVFVTLHDISASLQRKNLYQSRLNLLEFTHSHSLNELLIHTLDEVEKLTNSTISIYHFYDAEKQDITLNAWSTQTSAHFCHVAQAEGHYPLEKAGVWVDCVRQNRTVVHNDYASLPHRKGMPEGHAKVVRELVVPVKRKGQIVAILGVGNKPVDYTETDISTVTLFADLAWDIAERKRAEQQLQQSEERFRALFEQAGGYCMILDPNTADGIPLIVDANQAACQMHGYTKEEFIGRPVADIDDEEGKRLCLERTREIMTGKPFYVENVHTRKDGTPFHVAVNAQRIAIGDGPPLIFMTEYDITAIKLAEAESQKTNALLAMFMQHSPIYTFIKQVTPTESRVLLASENYEQMIGIPGSQLAGKTMAELFPAELANRITADDWAVVSRGEVLEIEEELNGRIYTSIKFPIQQETGTLLAGYSIDITERKQAEEILRKSEERHRTILQTALDGIWLVDQQGRFIEVNESYCRMSGYAEQELLKMGVSDVENLETVEDIEAHMQQVANDGNAFFVSQHRRKDGSLFDVEVSVQYQADDGGRFVVFLRDISERITAQKQKDYQKRLLERSQELGHIGTWELDIPANVLVWTDENYRIFGVPLETPISYETFLAQVHPEDRDFVDQKWRAALHGFPYDIEHRLLIGDRTKWVREKADIEFDNTGFAQKATGFTQDITDYKLSEQRRQELEAQLRQKTKMEAMGVLAGGMAHNFNNLLAIMLGNLALSRLKLDRNHEAYQKLNDAEAAGLRARDLIQQIMTYSRKAEVKRSPLRLALLIDETRQLLRSTLPSSALLQIVNNAPEAKIVANSTQMQEVLINLCTNAVHAMDGQGEVILTLDRLEISEETRLLRGELTPGQYAKLNIQDTGTGISDEIREQIFDPFFTTKRVGEGTGMGLSTVLGIVEQNEGRINLISSPGQGSTFELYFPLVQAEEDEIERSETTLMAGTERILFLDDEKMLAELGGQMLEEIGYQVTTETNSLKALEMIKADPLQFDLVITDQTMPGLTGIGLIEALKKIRPDLPVILCTGHSTKISAEDTEGLGISAYCQKPFEFVNFSETVRRVLDCKQK